MSREVGSNGRPNLPRRSPSASRVRFRDLSITPVQKTDASAGDANPWAEMEAQRKSEPTTPNISEAAQHLKRTLSLASVDTLLLLATSRNRPSPSSRGRTESGPVRSGPSSSGTTSPDPSPMSPSPGDFLEEDTVIARDRKLEDARELLRSVSQVVYRPPKGAHEGHHRPTDLERVVVLAIMKATRSFISAYGVRAGVALAMALFGSLRSRRFDLKLLFKSVVGLTPLRFSLLFATFTYTYSLALHSLRIAPPLSYIRRRIGHSLQLVKDTTSHAESILEALEEGVEVLSSDCSFGPPLMEYDDSYGERRWHAAFAGGIAGAASIYWVAQGERKGIVEQVMVRGLEGLWNGVARHNGWSIPGGEIVLFGLCAGQIMHSWLAAPERLPPSFNAFIGAAFQGPSAAVSIQRSLIKTGHVSEPDLVKLLEYGRGISAENRTTILGLLEELRSTGSCLHDGMIPCAVLHPSHTHCLPNLFARFSLVFRHVLPTYASLHFIPPLIFKRDLLFNRSSAPAVAAVDRTSVGEKAGEEADQLEDVPPLRKKARVNWSEVWKMLWRSLKGTARSGSFLSMFVVIYHAVICVQHKIHPHLSGSLKAVVASSQAYWFAGSLTAASLLLEENRRRSELALYVLPKGLSTLYSTARRRAWVPRTIPLSDGLLAGLAMGVICDRARWGEQDLSRLVKRVLYQFT